MAEKKRYILKFTKDSRTTSIVECALPSHYSKEEHFPRLLFRGSLLTLKMQSTANVSMRDIVGKF